MTPDRDANGKRRYGQWAGNPKGYPEDLTLCAEEVWDNWLTHQCSRKRGHGLNGEYCKQHAKHYPAETARTRTAQER